MAALKIPSLPDLERALDPAKDIVFLAGDFAPTPTQLERLEIFVRAGGTAWVHRLTPDTSFRDTLSRWVGTSLELRPPKMWLQQLETLSAASPLLNGINDFFTCWASFCWTNGDMNSVRTTPIVDYIISSPESQGQSLLDEPSWVGQWNFSPTSYLVTQAILIEIGSHTRNENPGSGLSVFPVGKGRIVIDQLRWNSVMFDTSSESLQKAKYLAGQLWKNIASGHRPPAGIPPEK